MAQYPLRHLRDTPDVTQALGNMLIAWAYAEDNLVIALHRVSGMRANMALAAYHRIPTFESRVKMIMGIIDEWRPANAEVDKDAIAKAITKLSKLAPTRNGYVHCAWQFDPGSRSIFIINMRADLESPQRRKLIKASDIEQHTKAVLERTEQLSHLIGSMGEV